jgi:hypothetical protein
MYVQYWNGNLLLKLVQGRRWAIPNWHGLGRQIGAAQRYLD